LDSIDNAINSGNWQFVSLNFEEDISDVDVVMSYSSGESSGTLQKAKTNSTSSFRLGEQTGSGNLGDFGKMLSFRIYPETLTDGEIAVLNQQKGRIN
jgi:hypothetical protein